MAGSSLKGITQTCNEEPPGVISIILDTIKSWLDDTEQD